MKRTGFVLALSAVALPLWAAAAAASPKTEASPDALWCIEQITVTWHNRPIVTTPVVCFPGP